MMMLDCRKRGIGEVGALMVVLFAGDWEWAMGLIWWVDGDGRNVFFRLG